jgi:hypothetical protein
MITTADEIIITLYNLKVNFMTSLDSVVGFVVVVVLSKIKIKKNQIFWCSSCKYYDNPVSFIYINLGQSTLREKGQIYMY